MYLDPTNLGTLSLILGWIVLLLFLVHALLVRPWLAYPEAPLGKIWPAFVVSLLLLWLLKAGLHQGLEIHLLGLAVFTLMFGAPLAILGITSVYILLAVAGKIAWSVLGWNAVLVGVFPILIAWLIHRMVYQRLPHNYFIFVFVSSFLNAAFVMAFTMALLTGFNLLTSSHTPQLIQDQFLRLTPMLMFPEAFLNGGIMAILVIYRPEWVLGFNADKYLRG